MGHRSTVALALALVAAVAPACARDGVGAEDPLAYLAVGVDPADEAERASLALARAGYLVGPRLDGRAFVAIGAARRRDRASAVRVITARGTAIALDAPDARFPDRLSVALLPARPPFELDDGPGEELAVAVELGPRTCVAIVRVTEEGAADEVALPLADLPGAPCVERLDDVAGDGRRELVTTLRFDGAGLDPAPSVPYALAAAGGRFARLPPALARGFYADERRAREEAASAAAGSERLRIAVELAAIASLEGGDAVAAYDRVAAPAEGVDDARRAARAFVAGGLGLDPGSAGDAPRDGLHAPP